MLASIRAGLKRRRRRASVVCAVLVLGALVTTAHASPGGEHDHMDEALTACLAVLATGVAAAAALPSLGRWLPDAPRAADARRPGAPDALTTRRAPARARGDPVLLQVLRL